MMVDACRHGFAAGREWCGRFLTGIEWWWLLMPLVAGGSVYAARANEGQGWARWWLSKGHHEVAALVLLGGTVAGFAVRLWLRRGGGRHAILLLALSAAFLCREIHFAGTTNGIWVAIGLILVWGAWWWPRINEALLQEPGRFMLLAAAFTYFCGQLIERRVFKASRLAVLPNEQAAHVMLEEVIENGAHLLFLLAAWRGIRNNHAAAPVTDSTSAAADCG